LEGEKKKKKLFGCGENQGGFGSMGVGCPILELRRDFKILVTSSEEQYRLFSFSKVCISPELVTKFKNPLELKTRQLQPIT